MRSLGRLLTVAFLASCGGSDGAPVDAGDTTPDAAQIDVAQTPDADTTPDALVIDAVPPPDADPRAFLCADDVVPDTAPDTLTLGGLVEENALASNPAQDAVVDVFLISDETTPVDSDTTGADGRYQVTVSTGGAPVSISGRMTKTDRIPLWIYPPRPMFADADNVDGLILNSFEVSFLDNSFGQSFDESKGFVIVIVTDCLGNGVAGATVTIEPDTGVRRYGDDEGFPSASRTATGASGFAYFLNVEPGTISVSASTSSRTFDTHSMGVHAGATNGTVMLP
jgi:hypothetical protein